MSRNNHVASEISVVGGFDVPKKVRRWACEERKEASLQDLGCSCFVSTADGGEGGGGLAGQATKLS